MAITFLAVFFCVLTALIRPIPASALTLSEEQKIGQKILEQVRKQLPLVEDGEILTYIRGVANRVAKETGVTPYQYQFFVIDQSIPNAFAVPGGYIFMFRGLIEMMETEGELAAIFAHELSHIHARHIHRQIDDSKVLSVASLAGMIGGILLGGGAMGPALATGSMAAGATMALRYSREHEMEADQLGFRFLCSAGYDPDDMVSIMHKMDQMKWTGSSGIPNYLSTHPAMGERVLYLDEMAKKYKATSPKPKKASASPGDFQLLQAALVADYADRGKALDRFNAGITQGNKAAVFGLGRLYLRQDRCVEAAAQLQEAARQIQSPFVLSSLGAAYHRLGRLKEAQKTLQSALVLDPSASIVHYRLALVLQDMGQRDEALDHLMKIVDLAPMFPEVDYQLGIILGQANRLGLAHYHLGRYYLYKQNPQLAIMHLKKAKALTLDSPAKIEEISESLKNLEKDKKNWGLKLN
ncbi:MAG: M48 family metalloprotease [Syntrophobacter sp.]